MAEFGSRPVSVDALRGGAVVTQRANTEVPPDVVPTATAPKKLQAWLERLHATTWPRGYKIGIARLSGGVGGSTLAAALSSVLVEKNALNGDATLLFDAAGSRFATPATRWGVPVTGVSVNGAISEGLTWTVGDDAWAGLARTAGGAHVLLGAAGDEPSVEPDKSATLLEGIRGAFADVVVDLPAGLPVDLPWVRDLGLTDLLFVTAGDRPSVTRTAEALVWLVHQGIAPDRLLVAVNHGVPGRRDRAAITQLASRCARLVELPAAKHLAAAPGGPAAQLPADAHISLIKLLLARSRQYTSRSGSATTATTTSPPANSSPETNQGENPWIKTAT